MSFSRMVKSKQLGMKVLLSSFHAYELSGHAHFRISSTDLKVGTPLYSALEHYFHGGMFSDASYAVQVDKTPHDYSIRGSCLSDTVQGGSRD